MVLLCVYMHLDSVTRGSDVSEEEDTPEVSPLLFLHDRSFSLCVPDLTKNSKDTEMGGFVKNTFFSIDEQTCVEYKQYKHPFIVENF